MSYLELHKLNLGYAKNTTSVKDLDLQVEQGELISLLGPSGCGKTTTMRAIAGLMPLQSGRIVLDGREIGKLAPNKRNIGMVFQSYALFPHLNVHDNIAFGLRLRKVAPGAAQKQGRGGDRRRRPDRFRDPPAGADVGRPAAARGAGARHRGRAGPAAAR